MSMQVIICQAFHSLFGKINAGLMFFKEQLQQCFRYLQNNPCIICLRQFDPKKKTVPNQIKSPFVVPLFFFKTAAHIVTMSCQQEIIEKFCSSHLNHKVHIPKIRSTVSQPLCFFRTNVLTFDFSQLYVKSLRTFQELHEK